jgi:hypothetical protein
MSEQPDPTIARGDTPSPATGSRFSPGAMLAGRYRIIAQLGRGGMGEVYRADDTKLGHPVALKFLPRYLIKDDRALDRIYAEVRLGRQVAHPNVCRLYDIGDSDEGTFITMEYVDGEDLASLLRRIGRLPVGKANEVARDIAAGLAAAHDVGIVHRDLKPANVMIDGRGRAKITDFGLAAVSSDASSGFAGTPAYMSPEQLSGGDVTLRSDIYALGLVLYEIFTGERLYDGNSLAEIQSQHRSGRRASISSVVREIDPAVERVVMRCLEEDPQSRPSTAHAVIAALPGGDPLAAAIAAGETPSPAMVAAAGQVGDVRPALAWVMLLAAIGGIAFLAFLAQRATLFPSALLPKSTDVLESRGADIAERFGYAARTSVAHEWIFNDAYLQYMQNRKHGVDRWNAIARTRPGVLLFAYRQGTKPMQATHDERRVSAEDPPMNMPGMVRVMIDTAGRLTSFVAVPPEHEVGSAKPFDWSSAFQEAALDPKTFHQVTPSWAAPVDVDDRRAWDGALPQQPDIPLRVEAGTHRGKLVWFVVHGPWDEQFEAFRAPPSLALRLSNWVTSLLSLWILPFAVLAAIRNIRRNRGDRRGAFRLALLIFLTAIAAFIIRADHSPEPVEEATLIALAAAKALYNAASAWVLYVAIEPFVRRRWPHLLTAWSRLLAGRVRDPMVGRDILFGLLAGIMLVILGDLTRIVPPWFGIPSPQPIVTATSPLASPRHALYFLLIILGDYIGAALAVLAAMVFVRALVKNTAVAAVIMTVTMGAAFAGIGDMPAGFVVAYSVLSAATLIFVMLRCGLLSLAITAYLFSALRAVPLTLDTSSWFFGRSFMAMAVFAALAIYGFIVALAGKPLFGTPLLDE